jgi:plasmid stabilization system protein ParE
VQKVVERLEMSPKVHAKIYKEARRALVKRFPYCVFYVVHGDLVEIAAVIHSKRHPRRWQERI